MSKNLLIGVVSACSLFGGLLAAVVAFGRLGNYFNTLKPFMAFSVVGFLCGLLVWRLLQRSLERTVPAELRKGTSAFGIVVGFIGFGLYFGTGFNSAIAHGSTYNCEILQKTNTRGGYRSAPRYFIHAEVNNKPASVECGYDYWSTLSVGDTVPITFMDSPFGFDFLDLPNDK